MILGQLVNQIRSIEDRRLIAMIEGDLALLEHYLHPELIYIHSTGRQDTRESLLEFLGSATFSYRALHHEFETVVAHGDLLILTGTLTGSLNAEDNIVKMESLTSSVWDFSSRAGQLLVFHASPR